MPPSPAGGQPKHSNLASIRGARAKRPEPIGVQAGLTFNELGENMSEEILAWVYEKPRDRWRLVVMGATVATLSNEAYQTGQRDAMLAQLLLNFTFRPLTMGERRASSESSLDELGQF
jgi:hypothetical protein